MNLDLNPEVKAIALAAAETLVAETLQDYNDALADFIAEPSQMFDNAESLRWRIAHDAQRALDALLAERQPCEIVFICVDGSIERHPQANRLAARAVLAEGYRTLQMLPDFHAMLLSEDAFEIMHKTCVKARGKYRIMPSAE